MADEKHCSIAVHETRDNKRSRKTINEYISWIVKYSFVASFKNSTRKMKLTRDMIQNAGIVGAFSNHFPGYKPIFNQMYIKQD